MKKWVVSQIVGQTFLSADVEWQTRMSALQTETLPKNGRIGRLRRSRGSSLLRSVIGRPADVERFLLGIIRLVARLDRRGADDATIRGGAAQGQAQDESEPAEPNGPHPACSV